MQLHEISDFHTVHTPELKERAQHSGRTTHTHHYIAQEDDIELAFVSIDRWPVDKPFFLYELFVARKQRNKGIGTRILQQIEKMAIEQGYRSIALTPKSIDNNYDNCTQRQIVRWYEKRGYRPNSEFVRQFDKQLFLKKPIEGA